MRFYANIRYLLLPVSALSIGAIFYVVFATDGFKLTPLAREFLKVFAIFLTVAFLMLEFILNRYITKCAGVARRFEEAANSALSLRVEIETMWYRHLVPLLIITSYLLIIAFWAGQVEWTAIHDGVRSNLPPYAPKTA
jgi:hypothetical protein